MKNLLFFLCRENSNPRLGTSFPGLNQVALCTINPEGPYCVDNGRSGTNRSRH